jgi:hypothetical protein
MVRSYEAVERTLSSQSLLKRPMTNAMNAWMVRHRLIMKESHDHHH